MSRIDALSLNICSTNPEESDTDVLAQILRLARVSLDMEVSFISEFLLARRYFRYVDSDEGFTPVQVGDSDPVEESYCQRVIDGRLPKLIPNAQKNPEAMKLDATSKLPVGAHVSIPIVFSDKTVFGTFCCFSRKGNDALCERDLELVQFVANCAAGLLEKSVTRDRKRMQKQLQIQEILLEDRLSMLFQPIYDLAKQHIVGFEALARFDTEPYRAPNKWFAEAEEVGADVELEMAAIEKAITALDSLPDESCYLSVNVSPAMVIKTPKQIEQILGNHCSRIMLEITEHKAVDDYKLLRKLLKPLQDNGMMLAVDDTGAGYSSFKHILELQPDMIKLDRCLVSGLDIDREKHSLASAMIAFAADTNTRVVAEGIETKQELASLVKLGVECGQGYLLGRPDSIQTFNEQALVRVPH